MNRNIQCSSLAWLLPVLVATTGVVYGEDINPDASMNGRYSKLLKKIHCPDDAKEFGEFKEYGYRAGESWCGASAINGYLVWLNPDWYVWRHKVRSSGGKRLPYVPGYSCDDGSKKKTRRAGLQAGTYRHCDGKPLLI